MPLLVDASNVLLAEGALSPDFAGPTLEELTSYIARSRFGREVVWIVCDHRVSTLRSGGIVIEGPGNCDDADERMLEILADSSAARRVTLVSSDRELAARARRMGATTMSSEEFLRQVERDLRSGGTKVSAPRAPSPRALVPLSNPQVSRWLKAFDLSEEILALQSATEIPAKLAAMIAPEPSVMRDAAMLRQVAVMREVAATREDPFEFFDSSQSDGFLEMFARLDNAAIEDLMQRYQPAAPVHPTRKKK